MKRLIPSVLFGLLLVPVPAFAQFGNTPADQEVRQWYNLFLKRNVDPGSAVWVDALKSGQAPNTVLSQILASTEYYIRCGSTDEGFVRQLHLELTGKPLGPRETQFWLNQLWRSDRQNIAYSMLSRYPQNYGSNYGSTYPPEPYEYRRFGHGRYR